MAKPNEMLAEKSLERSQFVELLVLYEPCGHTIITLHRLTNMVDGLGTNVYTYTSGGELYTEDGPFASDTVTNTYLYRQLDAGEDARPGRHGTRPRVKGSVNEIVISQ